MMEILNFNVVVVLLDFAMSSATISAKKSVQLRALAQKGLCSVRR